MQNLNFEKERETKILNFMILEGMLKAMQDLEFKIWFNFMQNSILKMEIKVVVINHLISKVTICKNFEWSTEI